MIVESVNNRKVLFPNPLLFFSSPRQFFTLMVDRPPSLTVPLLIILFTSVLIVIAAAAGSPVAPIFFNSEKFKQGIFLITLLFWGTLIFSLISISLLIETGWIKICFKVLGAKAKFIYLFSFLSYTFVPSLFGLLIEILFFKGSFGLSKGHLHVPYSKLSVAQYFPNYVDSHPFLFYIMTRIDPFKVWTLILGVFAVSALGKISYRKSFLIVFLFEIAYSIPYVLMSR